MGDSSRAGSPSYRPMSLRSSITDHFSSGAVPSSSELHDILRGLREYRDELEDRQRKLEKECSVLARTAYSAKAQSQAGPSRESASDAMGRRRPRAASPKRRESSRGASSGRQSVASSRAAGSVAPSAGSISPPPSLPSGSQRGGSPVLGKGKAKEQPSGGEVLSSHSASDAQDVGGHSKVKIKREADQDDAIGLSDHQSDIPADLRVPGEHDMDIDDAPPSRPNRTYAKGRRNQRGGSAKDGSATGDSEGESSGISDAERGRRSRSGSRRRDREATGSGKPNASGSAGPRRPLGIRLKLNPTAAPSGIAALGAAHQPVGIYGDYRPGGIGGGSSFIWTLPEEPSALIPSIPVSKPPKAYPTRPEDVDEDFTSMDWKERERLRDREEAFLPTNSASASPAPGQTHLHKEGPPGGAIGSAAANRVRSQNQQQVTYQTFQAYVDSWFKSLTDEDVAWLGTKEEDPEAFVIPPIGRHYKEVWEDEDNNGWAAVFSAGANGAGKDSKGHFNHRVPAFDPRTLADDHAFGTSLQEARGGPLTERVLSMVLPPTVPPASNDTLGLGTGEHESRSNAPNGRSAGSLVNGIHPPEPAASNGAPNSGYSNGDVPNGLNLFPPAPFLGKAAPQDMAQYEERIRKELRFLDILGSSSSEGDGLDAAASSSAIPGSSSVDADGIDWSTRTDDEISTTLRKVQSLLASQMEVNTARKLRLRDLAATRMAYQEYLTCLLNVEKNVELGWYKRQSLLKKLISKKKSTSKASAAAAAKPPSHPPIPGIGVDVTSLRSATPTNAAAVAGAAGGDDKKGTSAANPLLVAATKGAAAASTPTGTHPSTPHPYPDDASIGTPPLPGSPDPHSEYNAMAQNKLPALPPLADNLVQAMRQREQLKRAFEPLFEGKEEAKGAPRTSVFEGLGRSKAEALARGEIQDDF